MKTYLAIAASVAALAAVPAQAAQYMFQFAGQGLTASGVLTTSNTASTNARGGYTAYDITGITGTINGLAITGLASFLGTDNLYYTTGPAFLDGSGLGFTASGGANTSLSYIDITQVYRATSFVSGFTSVNVTASSSLVRAAVPEPATWAMMLIGFGALGVALRRRPTVATRARFA